MKKVRKLLAFMLSLALVLALLPAVTLSAEDTLLPDEAWLEDWGYCGGEGDGSNLRWEFYNESDVGCMLRITGSGAMADYEEGEAPWEGELSDYLLSGLILEDGITHIGANAFSYFSFVADYFALDIPDSVVSIGERAFYHNCQISSVRIGKGLKELGEASFGAMRNLQDFVCDSPCFSVLNGLLYNADGTVLICCPVDYRENVVFPDTITAIGDYAFDSCFVCNDPFVLPDSVTEIGSYAFHETTFIGDVFTVGRGVKTIGDYALSFCYDIAAYQSDSPDFCVVDGLLYSADRTELLVCPAYKKGEIHIDENVRIIRPGAFYGRTMLRGPRTLPDKLVEIGDSAFESCTGLGEGLTIPDSVERIGANAFFDSSLSGTITLGKELAFIGDGAFASWNISDFSGSSKGYRTQDGILYSADGTKLVSCPRGMTGEVKIPDTVTEIGNDAFLGCELLTGTLELPSGLKVIGDRAFYACYGLSGDVVIPDGVTEIGSEAFYECRKLNGTLVLSKNLRHIGDSAFCICINLHGELHFPDSLTTIGEHAFQSCKRLTGSLIFPEGLTSIGENAFSECERLDGRLSLPSTLTELGSGAFSNCVKLKGDLVIPDGLKCIREATFYRCHGLNGKLVIGRSVERIEDYAFIGCYNLHGSLTIPDSVEIIGYEAFYDCSGLTALRIGKGVKLIDISAFEQCYGLTGRIVLPDGLRTLGATAFARCTAVDDILVIPESVSAVGDEIVSGSAIRDVYFLGDMPYSLNPSMDGPVTGEGVTVHYNANAQGWDDMNSHWQEEKTEPFYSISAARFTDVNLRKFYTAPIAWAVDNGITTGKSVQKFAPEEACTRGQMVTFLWRAAGCPEPESASCPFDDVDLSAYYARAVLWAGENGIVNGMGEGKYAPDKTVTRGQMATILCRYLSGEATGDNPFGDIKPGAYYYDAVRWAYESGITTGVTSERFCPNDPCTRGQIVTFLFRAFDEEE